MNIQNNYSDEHISAYIDGELDSDERARLLFDEQKDASLTQRINEIRLLKEKVQLAFADAVSVSTAKKPFNCPAFISRHRAIAAGFFVLIAASAMFTYNMFTHSMVSNDNLVLAKNLITNTQPISANAINGAIGLHKRIVINVSQYHPQNFSETIAHIETILNQHSNDKSFNVEIIANKQGVKALDKETSIHAARLSLLAEKFDSLEVIACTKSLAKLASEGNPIQLMKSIMMTPSAAQLVAKRTNEGWLYLKI
jgi:intracellular sulfur oxidation DsrE/DsrF family protein